MAWTQTCALCSEELSARPQLRKPQTVKGHRPGSNKETTIVILVCDTCEAYLKSRLVEVWGERI